MDTRAQHLLNAKTQMQWSTMARRDAYDNCQHAREEQKRGNRIHAAFLFRECRLDLDFARWRLQDAMREKKKV